MSDNVTNHFGFLKRPSGDVIFAKDINNILDDIDEKLYMARFSGSMSVEGAAAAVAGGSAAWAQVVLDNEQEVLFASKVSLTKCRVIVSNAAALVLNEIQFALALASAPGVPITSVGESGAAGADVILTPLTGLVDIPANEEIILIEQDKALAGFVGAWDVQIVVEAEKVE